MAQQNINIGSAANDGTGDPLRTAFDKINDNFTEIYGATTEANDILEDSTPQLGGDLDVNGRRITSARSNEDIILLPNGTGGVVASGIRLAGTTISSDDSSSININEGLILDGTASVSGAATLSSTLGVTGATTLSSTLAVSGASTLTTTNIDNITIQDSNITSTSNADINITPGGTGSVVAAGVRVKGTTLSADDSSSININEGLIVDGTAAISGATTLTGAVTASSTLAVSGTTTLTTTNIDNITIQDGNISSSSNADINITPGGTGSTVIGSGISIKGTTITSADSSTININEGVNVDGTITVQGTTNTADIAATGNVTVAGSITTGTFAVGDLNIIADGTITSDTNGDIVIDPAGTGNIYLTGPIVATGTQTTTGQLNVDNLRLDGNVLSATSGAITLTPADGNNVTIGGTNTNLTAGEANFTLMEATTVRANFISSDTSNADIDITTQGTGVVKIEDTQLTLTGSFLPAIHTFVATDAVTITEHAGRTLLLGEVGGNAAVTLTLPAATGTGAVYKFIVSVTNTSNYKIQVADATDTIDGIMMYLDEDGTAVSAFPTVAASDTITLNGGTTGGIVGDYLELIDIATNQYHVRGVMRVAAGANPATPFTAAVS
jgi:fibronectin-binding autotransporter adhesin